MTLREFRQAEREHVAKSLDRVGIPTVAARLGEALEHDVHSLQLRQADLHLLGNEEAIGLLQDAIEKVETARRALAK